MQKVLLYFIGTFSFLLIAGSVSLTVLHSYQQVEEQGRALGESIQVTEAPLPTQIIPTATPEVTEPVILAQDTGANNENLERKTVTIFTRKDLERIWKTLYTTDAPPIPVVDFRKNAVMVVMAGSQPSGGYTVSFSGVTTEEDFTLVQFNETTPGPECLTASLMTSPFIVVQIPNEGKTFKSVFNTTQGSCSTPQ